MLSASLSSGMKWHEMGPGSLFPTDPDLADVLGDMDLDGPSVAQARFLEIRELGNLEIQKC